MTRVLIVEDDHALGKGISLALQRQDYTLDIVSTIDQANAHLKQHTYDLVLLDINLPDGNGIDLLLEIKSTYSIPVILITAKDLESDIVTGLELGADDYITKPFSLMVLRARANAQLRKLRQNNEIYSDSIYRFDFEQLSFTVQNQKIELSKSEIKLLQKLVVNRKQIVKREQLIDTLWQQDAQFVDENALSVTINRLRNKLHCRDLPTTPINTIYGIGYQWEVRHDVQQ